MEFGAVLEGHKEDDQGTMKLRSLEGWRKRVTSSFTLDRRQKQHSGGMSAEIHSVQPLSVSLRMEMHFGTVQSNLLIQDLSLSTYLRQLELASR